MPRSTEGNPLNGIAIAAGIVAVAGAVGVLAGRWSADEEPTPGAATTATVSERDALFATQYQRVFKREIEALGMRRAAALRRLRGAKTQAAQAAASADLARAHRHAAGALDRARVPIDVSQGHESIVAAMRRAAGAYRGLAQAAAAGKRSSYDAARRAVRAAEVRLRQRLMASLRTGGANPE